MKKDELKMFIDDLNKADSRFLTVFISVGLIDLSLVCILIYSKIVGIQ